MLTAAKVSPVFYEAVRFLRKKLPAAYPIRVRTIAPFKNGDLGDCDLKKLGSKSPFFLIRVVRGDEIRMVDCLLEEVAHALAWSHKHDHQDEPDYHGPEWGIAYAEVVRTWRGVK